MSCVIDDRTEFKKEDQTIVFENNLLHFTEEMIPEAIRRWTLDNCMQAEGSLNYGAVSAIIVCSNLIGYRCQVKPKVNGNWKVTPNLWGMLIGEPSQRKSPIANQFLKIVKMLESEKLNIFKEKTALHKEAKKRQLMSEKARDKILQKALDEFDEESISRADEICIPYVGEAPSPDRFIINDATTEAVGEIMQTNNRTLMQYRDELNGFFSSFEKSGREGDRAFYLEAFQGDASYTYDRIQRGTIHIKCLSIGIFGTIQPSVLAHNLLSKKGNHHDGLPQRMQLSVFSDNIYRTYFDELIDEDARNSAYNILHELTDANFELWGATNDLSDAIPYFSFNDDAQDIFIQWYEEFKVKEHAESNINVQGHLGKYYSLLPSLALVFFLIDKSAEITTSNAIEKKHIEMAKKWCTVLESHARKMYALGETYSSSITLSEKIVNFVIEHPEKLPATFGSLAGDIRGANAKDVEIALKGVVEVEGRKAIRLLSNVQRPIVQLSNKKNVGIEQLDNRTSYVKQFFKNIGRRMINVKN